MIDMMEQMVETHEKFRGRIIRVKEDVVILPNGKEARREIVEHPGGVGILVLDGQNRAALVKQYRYAFTRCLREIPAGKMEPGEEPEVTARRELREEVGVEAAQWASLGRMIPSPGCYGEMLHLYLARGLTPVGQQLDEDEFLQLEWVPFEILKQACLEGTVIDGKTVTAVLRAAGLLDL
ncbi:MAG: NUDIX hydrolase [Ruminococcaceae bacterium]|nr:NUDIX hydrolase [Oscillospiraceae bacterium]